MEIILALVPYRQNRDRIFALHLQCMSLKLSPTAINSLDLATST
jgi:hypothetical protein